MFIYIQIGNDSFFFQTIFVSNIFYPCMIFIKSDYYDRTISSTVEKRAIYPDIVNTAATSARIKASPDNWRHQPYWYCGRALSSACMVDVEGRLYFPGNSNDASDKADARTIRPPPNESPGTQMKLLLGLHPNVLNIYGFPAESVRHSWFTIETMLGVLFTGMEPTW